MESNLYTNLMYIDETKDLIREAIENKGELISEDEPFRNYVDHITNITTGENLEDVIAEQSAKIDELQNIIEMKSSGAGDEPRILVY